MAATITEFAILGVGGVLGGSGSILTARKSIRALNNSLAKVAVPPQSSPILGEAIQPGEEWTATNTVIFTSLATGLALLVASRWGVSLRAGAAMLFVLFTLTLAAIDLKTRFLPDALTVPLLWIGLLANTREAFAPIDSAVFGCVIGYGIPWLLLRIAGRQNENHVGFGDIKLISAFAAWLGLGSLLPVLLIASLAALIFIVARKAISNTKVTQPVAFGPFLALGGILTLLLGGEVLSLRALGHFSYAGCVLFGTRALG